MGQAPYAPYVGGISCGIADYTRFGEGDADKIAAFSARIRATGTGAGEHVFKTHDLVPALVPLFLEQNPDILVINVVQDFRDVLVSRLMYNRYHLPTVGKPVECRFVAENAHLSDLEMVRQFYGTSEMLDWLVNWKLFDQHIDHARYIRIEYEALLNDGELKRTVAMLGCRLLPEELTDEQVEELAAGSKFEAIEINLRRSRKQREVKSDFCRKGVAGDHERFLTKFQSSTLKLLTGR